MKHNLILLFILSIVLLSCSEDIGDNPDAEWTISEGSLLYPDMTETSCSGGWFIRIGNDTLRIYITMTDIEALVSGKELPVDVTIKWKKYTSGPCGTIKSNLIEAKDIQLKNSVYIISDAEITGFDARKCACCGGWFVNVGGDTHRILIAPADFSATLMNLKMPVKINMAWRKMTTGCGETTPGLIEVKNIFLLDTNYTISDGQIFGEDPRDCACCGGWFIRINGDTLRIDDMPKGFAQILTGDELPVDVKLSWKKMEHDCGWVMDDLIEVGHIYLKQ